MIATDMDGGGNGSDTSSNAAHNTLVDNGGSGKGKANKDADLHDPVYLETKEAGKNFEHFMLHKQTEQSEFIERSIRELSRLHEASTNFVLPKKRTAIRDQSDAGKGFIECREKAHSSLQKDVAGYHASNNLNYTNSWFHRLKEKVISAMEPPFGEVEGMFSKFSPLFEKG